MSKELQKEFDHVRQAFFPLWDKKEQWSISEITGPYSPHGYIDDKAKVIMVQSMTPGQSLRVLLIHEIAHAVSSLSHGKQWRDRVEKAAQRAEMAGETSLAQAVREEIRLYNEACTAVTPMAGTVYDRIKEACVSPSRPSFQQVVDSVRREYGLTREEFLRCFKRCRKVYEEATHPSLRRGKSRT